MPRHVSQESDCTRALSARGSFPLSLQFPLTLLSCLALLIVPQARADKIKLRGGGVFEGQVLDGKSTKKTLVLKRGKGEIRIPRSNIQEVIRESLPEEEYAKVRDKYPNTVDGHLEVAAWCDKNRLRDKAKFHLTKVIELDPDHKDARARLGYVWHEGQWVTEEEKRKAQGLVKYKGRYISVEQKEALEVQAAQKGGRKGLVQESPNVAKLAGVKERR